MKKLLGLTIFTLILLAALGAGPASAAAAPAVSQPGCQPALDLGQLAAVKGQTCPATAAPQTKVPEPEFMVGTRTCRCSCGFPCKTDADCGGALGSCRAGISCC